MYVELQNRAWLSWLAKVRILIITFLLGIELAITRLTTTNVPVRYFISIIMLWYTIAFFELLLVFLWREYNVQARLQILTDVIFTTALVYVTGDVDTYFNLYPLIILAASLQLTWLWAYMTAGLSFLLFALTLELTHFGILHSYAISPRADDRSLHILLGMNFLAYFAVAYLARNLSAKLRQEDVEALESLQALHENIINSMSGGLITTDLKGRISFLNAAGEKLLERRSAQLIGKNVHELFLDKLPQQKEQEKDELRYLGPSGKEQIFGLRISELRVPDRGVLGYIYSFADLTEIRRLEREVRMRDRLSAVGRMAAGIAHEIRNPLSSISGSVKVLSRISALNEEQHMLVDIVTRESERLNRIIGDFLAYSRDKNLKMSRVDLVALLEDTLTLLANHPQVAVEGGQPRIRVLRDFEVSEAPAIADGDKMKQVFWNLCENGVRALREGGVLTVSLMAEGSNWLIKFADNGPGIKAQQMEKIFEPFQSGFEGGTGLGLAMVYQIVEAHGGEISARSTPGQGAEFRLRLAIAEGAGALPAEQQAGLSEAAAPSNAESAVERSKAKVAHG